MPWLENTDGGIYLFYEVVPYVLFVSPQTNSSKHHEILAALSRVSTQVEAVSAQVDAGFSKLSIHLAELGLEVFSRLPGGNVPRLFVVLPDEWFSGSLSL